VGILDVKYFFFSSFAVLASSAASCRCEGRSTRRGSCMFSQRNGEICRWAACLVVHFTCHVNEINSFRRSVVLFARSQFLLNFQVLVAHLQMWKHKQPLSSLKISTKFLFRLTNQIIILSKKIQIKCNELIQCLEQGHKGLQRATYMYPKYTLM